MYRVLIADDEKGIREGLKRFIEKNFPDFQVIAAVEDGQKALEYSKALIPDVILTDINMPRMNGLEYLEIIKESLPETVLLVVSGYETFDYVLQCIHLGVREYFLKPVDTNRLKQVMCQLRPELERLQKRWQIRSEPWDGGKTGRILEEILTGGSQQVQVPARTYYPVCAYGNIQHELLYEKLRARFYGEAEVYSAAEREQECVLVLAFPPRFPAAFAAGVMRGLMAVHNYFMSTGGWDIRFLMGQPGDTGEKLHASWEELERLKDTIFRDAAEPVLSCNDVLQRRENSFTQPPAWIYKEIRHAAKNGSPEDIQKHCESIKTWLLSLEIVDVVFAKNAVEAVCSQLFFGSEAFFTEEMYGLFLDTKERIWQQTSFYGLIGAGDLLYGYAEHPGSDGRRSHECHQRHVPVHLPAVLPGDVRFHGAAGVRIRRRGQHRSGSDRRRRDAFVSVSGQTAGQDHGIGGAYEKEENHHLVDGKSRYKMDVSCGDVRLYPLPCLLRRHRFLQNQCGTDPGQRAVSGAVAL